MSQFIDALLHVDRYLLDLVAEYGSWVYAILFAIVFAETGLVVTPFLPGDSLLFAAGAILWVSVCVGAGYAFGNVPVIRNNFSLVALGIVVVSVLPMAIDLLRRWRAGTQARVRRQRPGT